ncbi:MAG: hypothetical protein J6S14_08620 [Clostridia bacterium]|nr:hypothetical protein [Clostridia bacterium]
MEKKVILPFEEQPYSLMYQGGAFSMGIIQANAKEDITPWLSSRYLNCWFSLAGGRHKFGYYLSESWPVTEGIMLHQYVRLFPSVLEELFCEDFLSFSKQMMDLGWYPHGLFNEQYIPGKRDYQKEYHVHDFLLIGYDDFEEVCYSVGYLEDGHFQKFSIPYSNMQQSILTMEDAKPTFNFWKLNKNAIFSLNIEKIILGLSEYLNSTISDEREKYDRSWGLEAVRNLGKYMMSCCEEQRSVDSRYTRGIMEHKNYMKMRVEYLLKHEYLSEKRYLELSEQVLKLSEKIHLLGLKYNITKNQNIGEHIVNLIEESICTELKYLPSVLSDLKSKEGE